MKEVNVNEYSDKPINLWAKKWLVLTSGDSTSYNAMTVGWGSIGTMWNKPFVQVVVRPVRFTYEFMEKYSTFTLCTFPEKYKDALRLIGTKSGRDGDKIKNAGLTVITSEVVEAPSFKEADMIIECKKMYYQDMDHTAFLDEKIDALYPDKDYHRIYFGEILTLRFPEE